MAPVVIEARGVSKTFRIPDRRIESLKERLTHPLQTIDHRELHALRDVSFDVHKGEFFGIVGRNGSGKSTLLKILASIYAANSGTVRVAGRMAPFIELGVGFNPENVAADNIVLNGVLMGLSRREALSRRDAVLDFAELQAFSDVKLKNYSSGMMVRLAFAIMVQADAEIMLIDEVLAVGDAAFAAKCMAVFQDRRARGRTVVLVTHDMGTVQALCHRALVLDEGELQYVGDPNDAAERYYRLNFSGDEIPGHNVEVVDVRTATDDDVRFEVTLRTLLPFRSGELKFQLRTVGSVTIAGVDHALGGMPAGHRLTLTGTFENRLVAGRHFLDCWVHRVGPDNSRMAQGLRLTEFDVEGPEAPGVVALRAEVREA